MDADGRGLRLDVRARPDRVPRRARPARPARGDGRHDPGGRRQPRREATSCPTFAGVAFSNNEFRWSARIKREDGLVRMVPGLGTRAVDRVGDDYPVLIAPGQPGLRVNVTPDEVVRYSPAKLDVINLEIGALRDGALEGRCSPTAARRSPVVQIPALALGRGRDPPPRPDRLEIRRRARSSPPSTGSRPRRRSFRRCAPLLRLLKEKTGRPGGHRVRLRWQGPVPPAVPPAELRRRTPPRRRSRTTSRRQGRSSRRSATSPTAGCATSRTSCTSTRSAYSALPDPESLRRVGRAVGAAEQASCRKRQFVLMGPGRWGSRGDIRLGVPRHLLGHQQHGGL